MHSQDLDAPYEDEDFEEEYEPDEFEEFEDDEVSFDFYSSAFKRLCLVAKISREWTPALNALDYRAVMFVFDRTVGWKKEWEAISRKQCVAGIVDHRNGKRYSRGFTSCEKQAGKVLARLVERGVLKRRNKFGNQAGYEYSINRDFDPSPFLEKPEKGGGKITLNGEVKPPPG